MVTTKFHVDVTLNSMVLLFCQIKIIKGLGVIIFQRWSKTMLTTDNRESREGSGDTAMMKKNVVTPGLTVPLPCGKVNMWAGKEQKDALGSLPRSFAPEFSVVEYSYTASGNCTEHQSQN